MRTRETLLPLHCRLLRRVEAALRVLVTGGAGFIGHHLVAALVRRGNEVIVNGRRPLDAVAAVLPLGVRYERSDLAVYGEADRLLGELGCDRVYHLASAVDVRRDLDLIDHQVSTTWLAAVHVARGCLTHGVARLVHVGTCEEYGNGPAPFRESQAPSPVSPYSAAKVAASAFVQMMAVSFGLPAVIVRPFLTYGLGQGTGQMIPALIQAGLEGRPFPMTAGEQTREFNHVEDIVDGLLRAGDTPGIEGEIFNLGCGEPRRIRDVASLVMALMGNPIRLGLGEIPYRPGETSSFYCINDKARDRLGYRAAVPLEDGLRRTIQGYREAAFAPPGYPRCP